jgi:RNA polymerase sigma-70 factor, ECF subfamily
MRDPARIRAAGSAVVQGEEVGMPDEGREQLGDALRAAWHRFVDEVAPLRPLLHGYCRKLAGNLFDAEDLAQDTLLRAFGQWGVTRPAIRNPKAYLLRTATNAWIDTLRRRETEARAPLADPDASPTPGPAPSASSDLREAGARLMQRLSPQERAALLLRESFDMSLEEIAELLATTVGAVKAALHRGRDRLREPTVRRPGPSPELVDRFIERFQARDVNGLLALMLEGASAENVGNSYHVGLDPEDGVPRFARALVHGHPEWPPQIQWQASRMERRDYQGEPIVLYLVTRKGRERLMSVLRFDEQEGRIARIRSYGFCPDTIRAFGEELGLPVYTGLYRAPE